MHLFIHLRSYHFIICLSDGFIWTSDPPFTSQFCFLHLSLYSIWSPPLLSHSLFHYSSRLCHHHHIFHHFTPPFRPFPLPTLGVLVPPEKEREKEKEEKLPGRRESHGENLLRDLKGIFTQPWEMSSPTEGNRLSLEENLGLWKGRVGGVCSVCPFCGRPLCFVLNRLKGISQSATNISCSLWRTTLIPYCSVCIGLITCLC